MSRPTLSDLLGLRADFEEKMAGEHGDQWLAAFKKFLRKENPWGDVAVIQPPPAPVQTVVRSLTFNEACEKAVELLGMSRQYVQFVEKFGNEQMPGCWTLPMFEGLTCNALFAVLKVELQKVGKDAWSVYSDIDKAVADDLKKKIKRNQRCPNRDGSYPITFKATVEADPENANQSANDRPWKSHNDITLMERIFLELVYFLMTGENLDVGNWTLCAGSRHSDGLVPRMFFSSGGRKVSVSCYDPGSRHVFLRARAAVPKNS